MPSVKDMIWHNFCTNVSAMVTDRANITIASKWEVGHGISIAIIRFDLVLFQRFRCKYKTFRMRLAIAHRIFSNTNPLDTRLVLAASDIEWI